MTKHSINNYDEYADAIAQSNHDGTNRAHKYIEKPAMKSALPDVRGKNVLCIGSGTGEECETLNSLGATVMGIDISEKSVELARENHPSLKFEVMDMNKLIFPDMSFDLIYSSLTLHYSEDLGKTLSEIRRVSKPGGNLLFSVLHPIKWSAEIRRDMEDERKKAFLLGYDSFQNPSTVFGDYLSVRPIVQKPEGYPTIKYWNRPISDYMKCLMEFDFCLKQFIEPRPVEDLKNVDLDYWNTQSKIPQFMIFLAERQGD